MFNWIKISIDDIIFSHHIICANRKIAHNAIKTKFIIQIIKNHLILKQLKKLVKQMSDPKLNLEEIDVKRL